MRLNAENGVTDAIGAARRQLFAVAPSSSLPSIISTSLMHWLEVYLTLKALGRLLSRSPPETVPIFDGFKRYILVNRAKRGEINRGQGRQNRGYLVVYRGPFHPGQVINSTSTGKAGTKSSTIISG